MYDHEKIIVTKYGLTKVRNSFISFAQFSV